MTEERTYPGRWEKWNQRFGHSTPRGHPCHVRTTQLDTQFDMVSLLPYSVFLINMKCPSIILLRIKPTSLIPTRTERSRFFTTKERKKGSKQTLSKP